MPSSLIFAGLVGTWLAVFVPMAARNRRPMKRTSDTALSSRVLERPVRTRPGGEEVSMAGPTGTRYRAGRGGYDPEAAELAARARYTFRQRVVLTLVLLAAAGAAVAVGLKVPEAWYVHGGAVVTLVLYLVNLRRQVRSEQQIQARRAARYAGNRRAPDRGSDRAPDRGSDRASDRAVRAGSDRAAGGKPAGGSTGRGRVIERGRRSSRRERTVAAEPAPEADVEADELDELSAHLRDNPVEVAPEPVPEPEAAEPMGTSALPLLEPVPLPTQPAGTHRLELDDEDPELHYLDNPDEPWGYRRAAGQ